MGRHIGHHIRTVITRVRRAVITGVAMPMVTVFLIDTTDALETRIATKGFVEAN
jgi:hypothetical protein